MRKAIGNRQYAMPLLGLATILMLSGCVVRTYPLVRDRIDQDLSTGNRGFLKGNAPTETERRSTRTTRVIEMELFPPVRFDTKPRAATLAQSAVVDKTEAEVSTEGNRGYITRSETPEIAEPAVASGSFEKYTVQKNDTLQKISKKFYGTTKYWKKIYNANKDKLKSANSIRPGQQLNIPVEAMKETSQNLK